MMNEEFLWVEKYRPKTIADTILPDKLKQTFQKFVDQKNIPNLLLTGTAGVGKTTVARAMLEELDCDYLIINGSNEGRLIETLRNEIANFASSMSFKGTRKYVILDEADYLNAQSVQPALRNLMEEFSSNCGFIFTCNFKAKIIAPLHSRCSVIDFKLNKEDRVKVAAQFMKRIQTILKQENVQYNTAVVAEVVKKYFPDWRRVLNELQRYSATGSIDTGIIATFTNENVGTLMKYLKTRDFTNIRKWVAENPEFTSDDLFKQFYDYAHEYMTADSIPELILILAEFQYKSSFVASQEINTVACLIEIMSRCQFK
jgi:DNA polymerase III delta prime subunit